MKRNHKEDSIYMQHKIKEALRDLGSAVDTLTLEVKDLEMEHIKPFIDVENKLIKLLADMKKGV